MTGPTRTGQTDLHGDLAAFGLRTGTGGARLGSLSGWCAMRRPLLVQPFAGSRSLRHEIRTPLNGVIGMAKLPATPDLDADQYEPRRTMIENVRALMVLINNILHLIRLSAGRMLLSPKPFGVPNAKRLACFAVHPRDSGISSTAMARIRAIKADQRAARRCPILMFTANSATADEAAFRDTGADSFVTKPGLRSALLAGFAAVLPAMAQDSATMPLTPARRIA